MFKINILSVLIIAVATFSSDLFAQDLSSELDGMYLGGQFGFTRGSAKHTFTNNAPPGDSEPNGTQFGIVVGYQTPVNNAVLFGIEADYNKPDISGDYINISGATSAGSIEFNTTYSINAKFAFIIENSGIVPYVLGGLSFVDADIYGGPSVNPKAGHYSALYQGLQIGGGIMLPMKNHLITSVELRYADYGKEEGSLSPTYPSIRMPVELQTNSILLSIRYKL